MLFHRFADDIQVYVSYNPAMSGTHKTAAHPVHRWN